VIVNEASVLVQLCDRLEQANQIQHDVAAIRARLERLDVLEKRLASASQFLAICRRKGLHVSNGQQTERSRALSDLNQFGIDFAADPKVILEGNRSRDLFAALDLAVSQCESEATTVWHAHATRNFNPASDEVLVLYERLGLFGEVVRRLRELARTLAALAEQHWVTESELDTFGYGVQKYAQLWRQVDLSVLPVAVQQFLHASGEPGGAPLELLTLEVVEWLQQREVTDRFRIRPFTPGAYAFR
jgi:hypothetical protein